MAQDFFDRDVLAVAPDILGKVLVRDFGKGETLRLTIREVEAYRGEEDLACHASKGRTQRTEVMYDRGGKVYVYLIYGMYWLLNVVVGPQDQPQAVLIRGSQEIQGPGRIGRALKLDKTFYGEDLITSNRLWLENGVLPSSPYSVSPRIGVEYAGPEWSMVPWRYTL